FLLRLMPLLPLPPHPSPRLFFSLFFFNDPATTDIYTLSLHDALPIYCLAHDRSVLSRVDRRILDFGLSSARMIDARPHRSFAHRSEEHTSELQSLTNLVCRLLLEKKKQYLRARYTSLMIMQDVVLVYM